MDFELFKDLVSKTKLEHPMWFVELDSDEIQKSEDLVNIEEGLVEIEEDLKVKFPKEYKDFIFEYGGGYFAFSNIYSLEKKSCWNIADLNHTYNGIRDNYLLFSENECGDFYGFKVVDGFCQSNIYFYDHEEDKWESTSYSNLFEYLKAVAFK